MLGGRGSRAAVRLLKTSFMVHCDFEKGSKKINIFKVLFWEGRGGGSQKKNTMCTVLILLTRIKVRLYSLGRCSHEVPGAGRPSGVSPTPHTSLYIYKTSHVDTD